MSNLQMMFYSVLTAITEFLPTSTLAVQNLIVYFFQLKIPPVLFLAANTVGVFLALLIFFRHEWASILAHLIQILIYPQHPKGLDERLPFFLLITSLPALLIFSCSNLDLKGILSTPFKSALSLLLIGIFFWIFKYFIKNIKLFYHFKLKDAFFVGIFQAITFFLGWNPFCGILMGAFLLNYQFQAAAQYSYFSLIPILIYRMIHAFQKVTDEPSPAKSQIYFFCFFTAVLVFFLVYTTLYYLQNNIHKRLNLFIFYQWLMALSIFLLSKETALLSYELVKKLMHSFSFLH